MTWPWEERARWEGLIAAFEDANPGVRVRPLFQKVGERWYEQADAALGPAHAWWQDVLEQGGLLDLLPFIEADPEFGSADFYPGMLSIHRRDGGQWALPVGASLNVLVYRPELFREIGAAIAAPDWTWQDVWEAARRVTASGEPDRRRYGFLARSTRQTLILACVAERARGLYRHESGQLLPTLDGPEVEAAAAACLTLAGEVTSLTEMPGDLAPADVLERLAQGEIGMDIMPLETVVAYLDWYPQLAVAALPPGQASAGLALTSSAELFISAASAHPQAAWRWVRFLSRQDLSPARTGDLPARRSLAERSGAWERWPPSVAAAVRQTLEHQAGHARSSEDAASEIVYEALSGALAQIQEGRLDARVALAGAQQAAVAGIQARRARPRPTPQRAASIPTPPPAQTAVTFQVSSQEERYQVAARAFEQAHPGYRIDVVPRGRHDLEGCVALEFDGDMLTSAGAQHLLADLGSLVAADRLLQAGNFWPQAMAATTWHGELLALPASVRPLVLHYDPAIFRRANIEPPAATWTIDDVLQAAERIEAAGQGDFGYAPEAREMRFVLSQQGIDLFTAGPPLRPRFTSPEVSDALARMSRLKSGRVAFPIPFEDAAALRRSGQVAMWFEVFSYGPSETSDPGTAFTPLHLRPGTALPVQVSAFGLSVGVEQPGPCWEWVVYLVRAGIHPAPGLSALRHQAADEAARPGPDQALLTAYHEALRSGQPSPAPSAASEDWAAWWFTRALQEAGRGEELAARLDVAQQRAETFMACLAATGERDLARGQACARMADPQHPLARLAP